MKTITAQQHRKRIIRVLNHIHANLDTELALIDLAELAHFSPFHFHRIWQSAMGESIAETTRRLRLIRAAEHLAIGSSVVDAAVAAHFDTARGFSRAFEKLYGTKPSEWRSGIHRSAGSENKKPEQNLLPVDVYRMPPRSLIALRHVGPYRCVGSAWETLSLWARERGIYENISAVIGLSYDDPSAVPATALRYDVCFEVDTEIEISGPVRALQLEGGMHARYRHEGHYFDIGKLYGQLFHGWLPQSDYSNAPAPCVDEYISHARVAGRREIVTYLNIPLCKKTSSLNLSTPIAQ
ncbi:MAG: transcriptional regulator [Verrucomicrobiaceae bacterium]|nr:transcriptional regulator [Verrucomicrobiaceae bacterium]